MLDYAHSQRDKEKPEKYMQHDPKSIEEYSSLILDGRRRSETPPDRRTVSGTLLSILFFAWGTLVYILGLAWLFAAINALTHTAQGWTIIGVGIISLISLIVILIMHKQPRLHWGMRLLLELAGTGLGLVTLLIGAGMSSAIYGILSPQVNLTLGIIALIYGLVTMVLALW
jgi:hypothetical protein